MQLNEVRLRSLKVKRRVLPMLDLFDTGFFCLVTGSGCRGFSECCNRATVEIHASIDLFPFRDPALLWFL